ncbi:MAG: CBS domain-containing protein [Nitrospirae bacterium]|nr:CBS domain-containing protein [Nitrospirota bacterium]MBF0534133.1 CBS domain-containing protein [Nitrospirota bacterium]MBF0617020.1 CBS domain-containing protein [Nitrospirota bacterium]
MTDRHSDKMSFCVTINDEDVYEAMKSISGYLDITSRDFKEVYQVAYKHALNRVTQSVVIKEVMTTDVVTVTADTPITEVSDRLSEHAISGMPVVDDSGKPVGVISEKDLLSRMGADHTLTFMSVVSLCLKHKCCKIMKIANLTAKNIMTTPAVCINENASIHEAVSVFKTKKINRIPVLSVDGRLVGIITRGDILRSPLFQINV